jgi:hypothetical protein
MKTIILNIYKFKLNLLILGLLSFIYTYKASSYSFVKLKMNNLKTNLNYLANILFFKPVNKLFLNSYYFYKKTCFNITNLFRHIRKTKETNKRLSERISMLIDTTSIATYIKYFLGLDVIDSDATITKIICTIIKNIILNVVWYIPLFIAELPMYYFGFIKNMEQIHYSSVKSILVIKLINLFIKTLHIIMLVMLSVMVLSFFMMYLGCIYMLIFRLKTFIFDKYTEFKRYIRVRITRRPIRI